MDLYTVQMAAIVGKDHPDILDITVKGQHVIGKAFAPTWAMVMDHKKKNYGHMADEVYTTEYHDLMVKSFYLNKNCWQWVLAQPRVVLACFCKPGDFCHRLLLAQYLVHLGATYKGEL